MNINLQIEFFENEKDLKKIIEKKSFTWSIILDQFNQSIQKF